MDIRHLRTFVTVARLRSITKAAESLHITQPAVSGQIKALEEELSLRLFQRTTYSIELTQAAIELLGRAEQALETFASFRNRAKSLTGQIEGSLRVGLTMIDPSEMRLGPFMREMVAGYPALQLKLQVNRIAWILDALRIGELDCALYVGRDLPAEIEGLKLSQIVYRLVAPSSWVTRLAGATLSDLGLMPWIRMTRPSAHYDMVSELLREASLKPVEVVEADHEIVIRSLVAAGIGIGLLREDVAREGVESGEMLFIGEQQSTMSLYFIHSVARTGDPAISGALSVLKQVWNL